MVIIAVLLVVLYQRIMKDFKKESEKEKLERGVRATKSRGKMDMEALAKHSAK